MIHPEIIPIPKVRSSVLQHRCGPPYVLALMLQVSGVVLHVVRDVPPTLTRLLWQLMEGVEEQYWQCRARLKFLLTEKSQRQQSLAQRARAARFTARYRRSSFTHTYPEQSALAL